jgi:hypothetical protein
MYRILKLSLPVFALAITVSACGKKADAPAADTTATTTTTTPPSTTTTTTTTPTTSSTTTTTTGTNDVDAAMKEYESVMMEYIAVAKKVKTDPSAANELSALTQKTTTMSQNMASVAAKMTPEQAQKWADMSQRLSKEAADAMK